MEDVTDTERRFAPQHPQLLRRQRQQNLRHLRDLRVVSYSSSDVRLRAS